MFKDFTKCSVMCLLIYGAFANSASAQNLDGTKLRDEQGNTQAQNLLGTMYAYGLGIPKDSDKAFRWFREAAT